MKAALQFLGTLSQSLNLVCRGTSRATLGSLQEEAHAITSIVLSPRRFSSDWKKKDWPERKMPITLKGKGNPKKDNRTVKRDSDRPSRVQRQNELKRLAKEVRKSRRGYDLPGTHSHPRNALEETKGQSNADRYKEEALIRKLEGAQSPNWHSWTPCTRKCRQDPVATDGEKPFN